MSADSPREAILVHGLWAPGFVMAPLAARLARTGLRCHGFAYRGRGEPLAAHAERLARLVRQIGRAHFVGHSLGGLVVIEALESDRALPAGRILLLGAPVSGCLAARRLARLAPGRWLLGESEPLWRAGRAAHWTRPEPLGVLAGRLPVGLGWAVGMLPGPNDGVVRVEETALEGMADRLIMPVSHSSMLVSARVAAQAAAFLASGRFRRDAA